METTTEAREALEGLREAREMMEEALEQARQSLAELTTGEGRAVRARAEAYWLAQLAGTIEGRVSMQSMAETMAELEQLAAGGGQA